MGTSATPNDRLASDHPNHVWALEFAYDQTDDCRTLKVMTITDECTNYVLAINVERSMTGDDIVTILQRLIVIHAAPRFARMSSGSEVSSNAIADW